VVDYLVYGMLLGVGYYQIGELLQRNVPQPRATMAGIPSQEVSTSSATTPVRVRRNSASTQPPRRKATTEPAGSQRNQG
jgi:hypothetical protein